MDGYQRQAEIGVTDATVVPWAFDGLGFDSDLRSKQDSLERFADVILDGMGVR
jgi:hypothetical protein